MSDGMRRELVYLSSHATNRYFIPNWGIIYFSLLIFYTSPRQCGLRNYLLLALGLFVYRDQL